MSRTGFFAVAALLAAASLANVGDAADPSPSVTFSPTSQDDVDQTIEAELRQAHASIDVAMFLFTSHRLASALIQAASHGVQVRVLLDGYNAQHFHSSQDGWLATNGVKVKRFSEGWGGGKFHHKFAVIDGSRVVTGSYNWTISGAAYDHENILVLGDATIAHAFAREFESLWTTGQGGVGSGGDVVFAPSSSSQCERRIASEIDQAQSEVVCAIYLFASDAIAQSLANAVHRGVHVSLLIDAQQVASYSNAKQVAQYLKGHGANVRLVHLPGSGAYANKFHHKYAVIDGKTVVTGSFNWAPNQDRHGWDNVVVLRDQGLAHDYIQNFSQVWGSHEAW